jgi:hypothetical protein
MSTIRLTNAIRLTRQVCVILGLVLLATTLVVMSGRALAGSASESSLNITGIDPGPGDCFTTRDGLGLIGSNLRAPDITVSVQRPTGEVEPAEIVSSTGSGQILRVRIHQSDWVSGMYTVKAVNGQGEQALVSFLVVYAEQCHNNGVTAYAHGDCREPQPPLCR